MQPQQLQSLLNFHTSLLPINCQQLRKEQESEHCAVFVEFQLIYIYEWWDAKG